MVWRRRRWRTDHKGRWGRGRKGRWSETRKERRAWARDDFGSAADEATFGTLHLISLASPFLRAGLTPDSARKASRHLRAILGVEAIAIVEAVTADAESAPVGAHAGAYGGRLAGPERVWRWGGRGPEHAAGRLLGWEGVGGAEHRTAVLGHVEPVVLSGRPRVVPTSRVACGDPECRIKVAIVAPLTVGGLVVGALAAYGPSAAPARVRAVGEVARWVSGQLELAELDSSRARVMEAEMRALRAQISPHFVYNSLTTIASFVRTDPERARELILDFADFARYSFRNPREFTTLSEELRSIDRYLLLERARFGERLRFQVEVAPEVLPVALPFLSLQPLVENAIRHGMEATREQFLVRIVARDAGTEAHISIEDDGVGMDPERVRAILSGDPGRSARGAGIGLANVDERLRQVYGDDYGLTVETAPGAGLKVSLRVPKYRPGVFAG